LIGGVVATACGSSDPAGEGSQPTPEGGTVDPVSGEIPCNVSTILDGACRNCHGTVPEFGAPMPLMTLGDLRAAAKSVPSRKVHQLVAEKVAAATGFMPPPPNPRLSEADRAVLAAWSNGGAPAAGPGEACGGGDGGTPDSSVVPQVSCVTDLKIAPTSAWEMPTNTGDEYVCYGVDVSRTTPTQVTAFAPRIDNSQIVHHIVLFEAPSSYSTTPQVCSSGGSLSWRMVMGWAPGGKGLELPPEAGFPIATSGSTHYVVQMHYSNPSAKVGQKDTSGFDLCTTTTLRPNDADVLAFGTQNIHMPAQPPAYDRTCSVTVPGPGSGIPLKLDGIHLFAAMPHMHQLGTEMSTTLVRGGAPGVDLGTVTGWSFSNQPWLKLGTTPQGIEVKANDVITTRCAWNNTTDGPVDFGENTADEMCYSFTMYYPKIASGAWSWAAPAYAAQCQ